MATFFKIDGLPPFDGNHPLDITYFTNRELHTIKRLSGIRAGELEDGFGSGDTDLLLALAIIALQRDGFTITKEMEDYLWDAPIGKMTLVAEDDEPAEDEGDVGPPSVTPSAASEPPALDATETNSGAASTNGGDPPASDQSPTGSPGLVNGAASDHATSAT